MANRETKCKTKFKTINIKCRQAVENWIAFTLLREVGNEEARTEDSMVISQK